MVFYQCLNLYPIESQADWKKKKIPPYQNKTSAQKKKEKKRMFAWWVSPADCKIRYKTPSIDLKNVGFKIVQFLKEKYLW